MLHSFVHDIKQWFLEAAAVLRHEFSAVFSNSGALIFFFALPLVYPLVYASIYNPEVTREMPVAVVDNCRSTDSREFVRHADATSGIKICGYAANMAEAKQWWAEHRCLAIIEIPANYTRRTFCGEQGVVNFYSDMSLLLRYRTFLQDITALQMATDAQLRNVALNTLGVDINTSGSSAVGVEAYFLGDPEQGFASFVMPGIVVLILQQSMILGILFLAGGENERRRLGSPFSNLGSQFSVLSSQLSPSAVIVGKMLCYVAIYIPLSLYILHFVPVIFSFPHLGSVADAMLFIFPMLIASAMMGLALRPLVKEPENAFVLFVVTSVAFLFLSGLTWPRYAMPDLLKALSAIIPATWGVQGFVRIDNNGATLAQQATPYITLWVLSLLYFLVAYFLQRRQSR
jgi:ABC-2 type transport system permease protein